MRIIAGTARGTALKTLPGTDVTRPTVARVKEGMFSAVQFLVPGARVLDAFAGSGQLGLEALSRGARSVQFCERGGEALRALNANVRLLGLDARRARVRKGDVLKDVPYARPPFDLVFLDPPYACAAAEVLGLVVALRTRAALSDDAIVVYEHASAANDEVEEAAKARDLSIAQRKKYGDTVVDVLRATALHDAID